MSSIDTGSPEAPFTTIVRGSLEAAKGSSVTCHFPLSSALVVFFWPANSTVTSSPRAATPEIGAGLSRCSTAWVETLCARGAASVCAAPYTDSTAATTVRTTRWIRFMTS